MHGWKHLALGAGVIFSIALGVVRPDVAPLPTASAEPNRTVPLATSPDTPTRRSPASAPPGGAAPDRWSHGPGATLRAQAAARTTPTSVSPAPAPPPSAGSPPDNLGQTPSGGLGSTVPAAVRRWEGFIVKYATQNGLDPNLVAAIIMTESEGNPNATSSRGAVGLMQVVGGSYDPETNIQQGTKLLADFLRRVNGDLELGLAAYNAGPGAVSQYNGLPPYAETQTYIFRVLNRFYLYSAG